MTKWTGINRFFHPVILVLLPCLAFLAFLVLFASLSVVDWESNTEIALPIVGARFYLGIITGLTGLLTLLMVPVARRFYALETELHDSHQGITRPVNPVVDRPQKDDCLYCYQLRIAPNPNNHNIPTVYIGSKEVQLPEQEKLVLQYLVDAHGEFCSNTDIFAYAWRDEDPIDVNRPLDRNRRHNLQARIAVIRKATRIETPSGQHDFIATLTRMKVRGYAFCQGPPSS